MNPTIPEKLYETIGNLDGGSQWLADLPVLIKAVVHKWYLDVQEPISDEASCSWVAPCVTADGQRAILKLGFPHMQAEHEIDGLMFWAGEPTVLVWRADPETNALLLERCEPGKTLRLLPEGEQDEIIAGILKRLWRRPKSPHPFRPLAEMFDYWCQESRSNADRAPDSILMEEGLAAFQELAATQTEQVLLATDLHAGNVLKAERCPWLAIDPKPFIGDPCYDATQHLLNCFGRLSDNPEQTVHRLSSLLEVDRQRVRHWMFARLATNYGANADAHVSVARKLAR